MSIACLPMYDWPEVRASTDAFWSRLRDHLRNEGFDAPEYLTRDGDSHWRDPNLLFGQTCGYPFAIGLTDAVQIIATPHYDVPGCEGPTYASAIVVRRDETRTRLQDFQGARLAANGSNSLSGYRCMVPLIGDPQGFFGSVLETGSHRASAAAVAAGEADIAALDPLSANFGERFDAPVFARLQTLHRAPAFPALPFITSAKRSKEECAAIRRALAKSMEDQAYNSPRRNLRLSAASTVKINDYRALSSL